MIYNNIDSVISGLQSDISDMEDFIVAIERHVYSGRELSANDLRDISSQLVFYNHPKYIHICDYLNELANKMVAAQS